MEQYKAYRFKFISIAKDATHLRKNKFANPYEITFDPIEDIMDVNSLLNLILNKNINEQQALYEFIKSELGTEVDIINTSVWTR